MRTVAVTRSAGAFQATDREILDRPFGLRAPVRVGRDAYLSKGIALDPHGRRAGRVSARIRRHFRLNYTARMLPSFFDSVVALITRTSTDLPPDVRHAMGLALATEERNTRAGQALTIIAQNIDQAASCEGPICQDTGMPTFEVRVPVGANQIWMKQQIRAAIAEATRRGKLRPNSVDSITGENSGDNLGPGTPIVHFEQWEEDEIEVKLILKGGGCENTNAQYSLPTELDHLGRADRTLDGVRKCILHAVWKAQGKGCSPGAVGVCIGGDRTSGYLHAKEQLFRTLDDINADPRLAELETSVMTTANELTVGPMGFGGQTSLIGCKISALNRLPASFFVSIAYDCWAFRRLGVRLDSRTGAITSWLYREGDMASAPMLTAKETAAGFPMTGREVRLTAPISEEQVRALKVGDVVLDFRPHIHRSRRCPRSSHEERSACGPPWRRPVPLRPSRREGTGRVARDGRRSDHEHSRGAVSGRNSEALRRPCGDRQGRHGRKDACRLEGGRGRLSQRCRWRSAVLCEVYRARRWTCRCCSSARPKRCGTSRSADFPAIVTMDAHGNSLHADIETASGRKLETART